MGLQETVNLVAGLKAEQTPQIGFVNSTVTVFVRREGLQRSTSQISAAIKEANCEIIGNLHGDFHKTTLLRQ